MKYSRSVTRTIENLLPADVLDVLSEHGWNVFGIYELVRRELDRERRRITATPDHANSGAGAVEEAG